MIWVMDDPTRFLAEKSELEKLESGVDWLSTSWRMLENGLFVVDLTVTVYGRPFVGQMTYPATFPNSPPYIRPLDSSELWSGHQYGPGGSLCLEWRADNWQTTVTGADMVRSAYSLLSAEHHPELPHAVPSAHRQTEGQSMRVTKQRFVGTSSLRLKFLALDMQSKTALKSSTKFHGATTVRFVTELADHQGDFKPVEDIPEGVYTSFPFFSLSEEGLILRSSFFDQKLDIRSISMLMETIASAGFEVDNIQMEEDGTYKSKMIILMGSEISSLRIFSMVMGKNPGLQEHGIIWPSLSGGRLFDESNNLANLRIGIVGLGSIGSKVAISLARSGVRHFLLVDDDYLTIGNMVRHELSWAYMGEHKVYAVKDKLSLIAPGLKVDVRTTRLAGQESAVNTAAAHKDLSNCDLLIDATANPEVFLVLASLAKKYKKPLCWGEVFAGGYGGMIARARPGFDPNPLRVRDIYYEYLSQLPEAPFKNAGGYDGFEEQPLIAYDSDVTFVSASLTRLVIDTALARNPSSFLNSLYLLGMSRMWIFKQVFDTRPISMPSEDWEEEKKINSEDLIAVAKAISEMNKGVQSVNPDVAS